MSEQIQELETSFDIKQYSSETFKQIFGTIGQLVEDATFEITNEGLTFRGMDPSHVALIDLVMSNASFEKWLVNQEGSFAVRVNELNKLLKNFNKKDSVRLYTKEHMLAIETKTSKTNLRLIEASKVNCPLPKILYNSRIQITLDALKRSLKQIETVSDYVTLETTLNRDFILSGKGDSGESTINFERGMEEIPEISNKEPSKATYSLEYLLPFLKQLKCGSVIIEYSSVKPLRIEAPIDNISKIFFYLAPRVEN